MISFSLSEFLTRVRVSVQDAYPVPVWVRAEVSALSARPGSHCYMEFAEKGADGQQYAARIHANCWRNIWADIAARFEAATGQPIRLGLQILALVRVDFHPVFGMSLTVQDIDPSFTLGELARQKQEALRKLEDEGIIDMQQTLQLPTLPKRLAVVSAASAAGYQDFIHQLQNNAYGFAFRATLFDAIMQGDSAPESIITALNDIYNDLLLHPGAYDAVVIIRGGGASTDLSCFDNYDLAATCAQFPLPILAGIGHTRDVSLVDRVAYRSVKTPTAAAEFLIGLLTEQLTTLEELSTRLQRTASSQVALRRAALDRTDMQIRLGLHARLQAQRSLLDLTEKTILLHSPERIFRQGYSLTTCNGRVVRDAAKLQKGDVIRTEFASGQAESVVL